MDFNCNNNKLAVCAIILSIVSTALLIKLNIMQQRVTEYQLKQIEDREKKAQG
jgi:hypothetical protein